MKEITPTPSPTNNPLQTFYTEHKIKQYSCFSGGFKPPTLPQRVSKQQTVFDGHISKDRLYKEFGIVKSVSYEQPYKLEKEYVPDSKLELADRLLEKMEHQRLKISYYREKYVKGQSRNV